MRFIVTVRCPLVVCALLGLAEATLGDDMFGYLAKESIVASIEESHKQGGFTLLPFTVSGKEAGTQINRDMQNLRKLLVTGASKDGLPTAIVALLDANQAGYLYGCLAASTSGREIELVEALASRGFTNDAASNAIALYGVYILYNGAKDKKSLQESVRMLTKSFVLKSLPLARIGKFDDMASALQKVIEQPISEPPVPVPK